MNILKIDNHLYNIALHSFYADINHIYEYKLEQNEFIMMQHDIGTKHDFKRRELGHFLISVKISTFI